MTANISPIIPVEERISKLLSLIGQPARIQILFAIGDEETCVCHLEAVLGTRQASISQHLMVLRKAGLVTWRRDGRNIFYRLANPGVVGLLEQAGEITGIDLDCLKELAVRPASGCPCPQCNPGIDPKLSCQNIKIARPSAIKEQ